MVDLGDPPVVAKLVVRVPMSMCFSKFEALYVKRVMESDFGLQKSSKLQTNDTKSCKMHQKKEPKAPELSQK